jgi:hypothetical protein
VSTHAGFSELLDQIVHGALQLAIIQERESSRDRARDSRRCVHDVDRGSMPLGDLERA